MQQQQQQQQIAAATAPWSSTYNNISSVPMLPEVSEEPFYRTTRSMSYSFGHNNNTNPFSPTPSSYYLPDATQDTTFMQQQQENFLLEEEEEEEEREQADILRFMYIRTRSKSTAAVMVAPPPPHENDNNIWNPQKKELEDDAKWFAQHNKRRSSLVSSSNTVFPPMMSSSSSSTTTASSGIRRFSLAPSAAATASSYFDNNTTMSAATPMFLVGQRRHSLAGPTTIHHQQSSSLMMNSILEIEGLSIREKPAAAVNNMESSPPMTTTTSKTTKKMDEMGKGTRLDLLHGVYFYVVEFKAGRSDVFYSIQLYNKNELVIVEADRGRDLGKIAQQNIPRHQLEIYYAQLKSASHSNFEEEQQEEEAVKTIYQPNEIYVKNVFRMAKRDEITLFMTKVQDEAKALMVCQSKIKQKKLNMQVVDAEYQWSVIKNYPRLN